MMQSQPTTELQGMTGSQTAGVVKTGLAVAAVGLGVLGLWVYLRGGRKTSGLQELSPVGARREQQRPKPWTLTLHYIDRATGSTVDFRTIAVTTFHEASNRLRHYVDSRDLGGSQLGTGCGDIHDAAGKFVGHVSYNGRVWPTSPMAWKVSHKPLYNPMAWGREGLDEVSLHPEWYARIPRRGPKAPKGKLRVRLEARGNPDWRGRDLRLANMHVPTVHAVVRSLAEASKTVVGFIVARNVGYGNYADSGAVYDDTGHLVAYVTYNGRVWNPYSGEEIPLS